MKIYAILHNVRSAHNVGSIWRTADGAGVAKIYITGYTPTPVDRFGRKRADIAKTSLGATEFIPHEVATDLPVLIKKLQQEGINVVAVEQDTRAIPYTSFTPTGDTAFIFGNEVTGLENDVLTSVDAVVHIPMYGKKESLNVSVATGIILFHARS